MRRGRQLPDCWLLDCRVNAPSPETSARRRLREPFNAVTHLLGALLALAGGSYLVAASAGEPWRLASFAVFGLTSVALFTASTLLHAMPSPDRGARWRRRADHAAIFLLIAGSYTPVTLVTLRSGASAWAWPLFATVWALAFLGVVFKLVWFHAPRGVSTALYVLMGWLAVAAIGPIVAAMRPGGVAMLAVGGVLYTVGAVIYARKRPDPAPGRIGYHGLWHLFVLAGWGAHFAMMALYVLPA